MEFLAQLGGIYFIVFLIGLFIWWIWKGIELAIEQKINQHNREDDAHQFMVSERLRNHNSDENAHWKSISAGIAKHDGDELAHHVSRTNQEPVEAK